MQSIVRIIFLMMKWWRLLKISCNLVIWRETSTKIEKKTRGVSLGMLFNCPSTYQDIYWINRYHYVGAQYVGVVSYFCLMYKERNHMLSSWSNDTRLNTNITKIQVAKLSTILYVHLVCTKFWILKCALCSLYNAKTQEQQYGTKQQPHISIAPYHSKTSPNAT